jgi:hypothetical protein
MARTVPAVIIVMAVLLSACGGHRSAAVVGRRDEPPATPVPVPQTGTLPPGPIRPACQLVTREEVAAAVGNPVGAGTGQGRNCSWGTGVDGGTSVSVTAVKPGSGGIAFDCDSLRQGQSHEGKHETVNGVGTSATWVYQSLTTLTQASLVACWTDSAVMVLLTGERDIPALRTSAVNLAQQVHSRS